MGWFTDLVNTLHRIGQPKLSEQIEKTSVGGSHATTSFDQIVVVNLKEKENAIRDGISEASKGGYANNVRSVIDANLTKTEIAICNSIGIDIKNGFLQQQTIEKLGGIMNVFNLMQKAAEQDAKLNQYLPSEAYRFVGGTSEVVQTMLKEQREKAERDAVSLPDSYQRTATLNQLYNSAFEYIGPYGNNIDSETLLKYAETRGAMPIQVGGQNPYVEEVDLTAAISLARFVRNGFVSKDALESVGGPAKVLKEMAIDAKLSAKSFGYLPSKAKDYMVSPIDTINKMPKQQEQGLEI